MSQLIDSATFDERVLQDPNHDSRDQTEDVKTAQDTQFSDFGFSNDLLSGIADCLFYRPSPIQCEVIPKVLAGHSIVARAKNGTGKTAAYCLPLIHCIDPTENKLQAVIVTSTQELVTQVTNTIERLTTHIPIRVVGSSKTVPFQTTLRALSSCHILVATSGRILSLAQQSPTIAAVRYAVVDEVDAVITVCPDFVMQFFSMLSPDAIKMVFSATYPEEIATKVQQAKNLMPNCATCIPVAQLSLVGITQHYVVAEESAKVKALHHLLQILDIDQCIIFTRTEDRAELISKLLTTKWGLPCYAVTTAHKDDRARIMKLFQQGKFRFLTSANLGSRGIDIPRVNVVINFDLPENGDDFLQRTGRAGRFGHLGLAVSLVRRDQASIVSKIQNQLKCKITRFPNVLDHNVYSKPLAGQTRAPTPQDVDAKPQQE